MGHNQHVWARPPARAKAGSLQRIRLDATSRAQLDRGARLVELLKQPQFSPMPVEQQVVTVWAGTGTATDTNDGFLPRNLTIHVGDRVTWRSGGVHFHTVSFGIDPRKTPLLVPVGKDAHGAPMLAVNSVIAAPVVPAGGLYTGGVASSGIGGLTGNYLNLPGQQFLKAPFTLRFAKPGVYTYYCLVHPGMAGTITVVPATGASGRS